MGQNQLPFFPPWTWLSLIDFPALEVEVLGKDELRIVGTNWSNSQEQRTGTECPKVFPGTGTVLSVAQLGYCSLLL